jgi:hypothetical protein
LKAKPSTIPHQLLEDELRRGMTSIESYIDFARIALQKARDTALIVERQRNSGFVICAYGAAAKAHTFFNFANIRADIVVDDNPLKQSRRSPGSGVIIQDPICLSEIDQPIQFVVGAWNFASEIKGHIARIRPGKNGDQFLQYFPEVINSGH